MGGADCASARYIHTELNMPIVDKLFCKKDFPLLTYMDDDGIPIEPEYYVPLIPLILVNGGKGIGTGFSTNIPQYNPKDIINNLIRKINTQPPIETFPWYRDFKGTIVKRNDVSYMSKGKYHKLSGEDNEDTICVTELPIGCWTQDFKELLEILSGYDIESSKSKKKTNSKKKDNSKQKKESIIVEYRDNSDESNINFTITFNEFLLEELETKVDKDGVNGVEKVLKLTTTKNTNLNNIHLYNHKGVITLYKKVEEIIDEFYTVRIEIYHKRKTHIINELSRELKKINAKVAFIHGIITDDIIVNKQNKKSIYIQLYNKNFPYIYMDNKEIHIIDITDKKKLNDKELDTLCKTNKYDYLIKLPIDSLTLEKIDEFEKLKANYESEIEQVEKETVEETYLKELNDLSKTYNKLYK
jgi:DNA topoisomerase-2